jgi:hypothetical protein
MIQCTLEKDHSKQYAGVATSCPLSQAIQAKGHARAETPCWSNCMPRLFQPVETLRRKTNEITQGCSHDMPALLNECQIFVPYAAWAVTRISFPTNLDKESHRSFMLHGTTSYSNSCRWMEACGVQRPAEGCTESIFTRALKLFQAILSKKMPSRPYCRANGHMSQSGMRRPNGGLSHWESWREEAIVSRFDKYSGRNDK